MTYQVKSTVDFKRMRELFFAKDNYTLSGEGPLQRHLSSVQGRSRADGRFRQRRRRPADRRPRLRVPEPEGQARLVPEPVRGDRHDDRFLRRRGVAEIFHSVGRTRRRAVEGATSTPNGRTSILPTYSDFLRLPGLAPRGPMVGPQSHGVASRPFLANMPAMATPKWCRRPVSMCWQASRRVRSRASPIAGGFHPGVGHLPIAGRGELSLRRRRGGVFRRPFFDAGDRRHLQRPHRLGRRLAYCVRGDQRRPAGKRPRAGGHDDGIRRADQPDYGRRNR